ncbi:MAG: NERD domain-containing protein [Bacteroidales bacterium]|jgi:hypothetical protein|nr:NERD domain-containing protein [Bacteroidales bacterium]
MEALFIVVFVLLIVLSFLFKSSKTKGGIFPKWKGEVCATRKGEIGEMIVGSNLGDNITSEKYVINDLLLFSEGRSYQIDHLVIRKTGIFVVETKNYSGLIYGDDKRKEWTQVLNYGKMKNKFYNPILQNKSKIYALSKIIGRKDCFISIICFPEAEIMTNFNEKVGSISDMRKWLNQDMDEILTSTEIDNFYQRLIDCKNNPKLTNEKHVDNIYRLQRRIANNICPRCVKILMLREGKYGSFYGCSGYPYCKFVKK